MEHFTTIISLHINNPSNNIHVGGYFGIESIYTRDKMISSLPSFFYLIISYGSSAIIALILMVIFYILKRRAIKSESNDNLFPDNDKK